MSVLINVFGFCLIVFIVYWFWWPDLKERFKK